jgi:GNAT superfamily N-acetyltransferase
MRLLLDTNVLIPLEPGADDFGPLVPVAAELHQLLTRGGHQPLLHPAHRADLQRDPDDARRARTTALAAKYELLDHAPAPTADMVAAIGSPTPGSNDWVDDQLLAALEADAVDYLVTQDIEIAKKARKLGLGERVATVAEAVGLLRNLFDLPVEPPPAVDHRKAHELDLSDPIFESIRADYPDFDRWIKTVRREGRDAWVIFGDGDIYAAIALIKPEKELDGLRARILKISTFKVSDAHRGRHYGELLLKTTFEHARVNGYDVIYLTVYPRHQELIDLLGEFGFAQYSVLSDGQLVMLKDRRPDLTADLDSLAFHVRHGPPAIKGVDASTYVVPIQPRYHELLFPEQSGGYQMRLFDDRDQPFGNALRKAYLSRSGIRSLNAGALLLFYRSTDSQAVTTLGILEKWIASDEPAEIARFVGKRTVYAYDEIAEMCAGNVVLALLFRQDRVFSPAMALADLVEHRVIRGAPQSITQANAEGLSWLAEQIKA